MTAKLRRVGFMVHTPAVSRGFASAKIPPTSSIDSDAEIATAPFNLCWVRKVIGKQIRRALRSNSRHGRIFSSATAAFSVVWPRPALFAVVG
jgi:hypothetical protein